MTVVVTRNVSNRIRGFLASSMLELAPGVYSSARMSAGVRDRVCEVLEDWFGSENDAGIVMVYADAQMPGGQSVRILGTPPIQLVELDGMVLARRDSKQPPHHPSTVA